MNKKVTMKGTPLGPQVCHIATFFHCSNCFADRPVNQTPQQWARTQAGFTQWGIQIWCNRCNRSVVHWDLLGQQMDKVSDNLPKDAQPEPLTERQLHFITVRSNPRAGGRLRWVRDDAPDGVSGGSQTAPPAAPDVPSRPAGPGVATGIAGAEPEEPDGPSPGLGGAVVD